MKAFRSNFSVYFTIAAVALVSAAGGTIFGQTTLLLGEDEFAEVGLPFTFPFCGVDHNSVFVGSNGYVTFGKGDTDFFGTLDEFRDVPPRIAPLWLDLSPNQGGTVTVEVVAGDFVVTWDGVPVHNTGNSNTLALTLRPDGTFRFDYVSLDAAGGLVGISPGLGAITGDPGEIDLDLFAPAPIVGAAGDAVYELFDAGDNDLSGLALEWAACPDVDFLRPALPGVCYGSTGQGGASPGSLLTINTTTGAATVVGPTSLTGVPGLAIDSFGRIFGTERSTGNLYRIDAQTGQAFFVAEVAPFLDGIAFDEDDVLYAVAFDAFFTLLTIDTFNGVTTPVGPTGESISGLAVDPTNGQLYGSAGGFFPTSPDGIIQIDRNTGASDVIGTTELGGATPDLMFDESGNLFGVKGGGGGNPGGGGGGTPNQLIAVNKVNGVGTPIGGPTGVASVSGLACALPEPEEEDADGDGVLDDDDLCPDTVIPEGVPTVQLKANRWALVDEDGVFDTGPPKGKGKGQGQNPEGFTIEQTKGCSCEQIIEILALGQGHMKFGCNTDAMNTFIAQVNP